MALASYTVVAQDEAGNVVSGASIEVRSETTGLLVPLFSDIEGLDSLGNPFFTETNGVAEFFCVPDFYQITATVGGLTSTMRHVCIGPIGRSVGDPQDVDGDAYDAINHRYNNTVSGLEAETTQEAIDEVVALLTFTGAVLTYAAGAALPASNIGPIYHADYASIMAWQVFDANGAAYTGYASVGIGDITTPGGSTARTGTLKANGADLSTTTYAALYGWAKHNGLVVASGDWTAGMEKYRENGGGTFRLPDLRGRFFRVWADGGTIDSGRAFGTTQTHMLENHAHTVNTLTLTSFSGADAGSGFSNTSVSTSNPSTGTAGDETRPLNTAVLATIKF